MVILSANPRRHGRPLIFGFIMDHDAPLWVFRVSVIVMVVTAVLALFADRYGAAKRRRLAEAAA